MYCKECGFHSSDDAKFCPNCGTKVELNGIGNIEQQAVFGGIEKDEEVNKDSVNEKAHWNNEYEDNKKTSKEPNRVKRKKIIRTKATTLPNVFVSYYSFEDDLCSELSPFWYVDSLGVPLSEYFDKLSLTVINSTTIVQKHKYQKWACGKFEYDNNCNLKFKIVTKYLFDDIDEYDGDVNQSFFLLKYNQDIYGYDGDFYKMKKKKKICGDTLSVGFTILGGGVIGSAIFCVMGLIYGLLCGLNIKEAMNAPVGTGGTALWVILLVVSIIVIGYKVLLYDEYEQDFKISDSLFK